MTTTTVPTNVPTADPACDQVSVSALSFTPDSDLTTAFVQAAQAATEHGGPIGTVYLIHFNQPYRHARHYTGWTLNLDTRLTQHHAGHGARLLAVAKAAGITWKLARTWEGTRHLERALKRQGGAARRCPLCGITPRPTTNHSEGGPLCTV